MINWIFIDVGNVILNDDPVMALIYKITHEAIAERGHDLTLAQLLREREQHLAGNVNGEAHRALAIKYLGLDEFRKVRRRYHRQMIADLFNIYPLMPRIVPVLRSLSRDYRLALLANQPAAAEGLLKRHGIWQLFQQHFISEVLQLRKPDPAFFQHALDATSCPPHEALMIGDRLDNDIIPAKRLGMKTLWFVPPMERKGHEPRQEWERLYIDSLSRADANHRPLDDAEAQPDYTARDFDEIPSGVARIREECSKAG